mmetsp:Transcript_133930/g.250562  ORF Transcript_133930/g.250562 Transcript_133930/m.250562 type:complete len:206 (-) Transcript_133930:90-707(-)
MQAAVRVRHELFWPVKCLRKFCNAAPPVQALVHCRAATQSPGCFHIGTHLRMAPEWRRTADKPPDRPLPMVHRAVHDCGAPVLSSSVPIASIKQQHTGPRIMCCQSSCGSRAPTSSAYNHIIEGLLAQLPVLMEPFYSLTPASPFSLPPLLLFCISATPVEGVVAIKTIRMAFFTKLLAATKLCIKATSPATLKCDHIRHKSKEQ